MLFFVYYYAVKLYTSEQVIQAESFYSLFGGRLGAGEMRPVAGVGERGGGGLSLHQPMAMGALGQCLYSSVCADARHRGAITQTPLK